MTIKFIKLFGKYSFDFHYFPLDILAFHYPKSMGVACRDNSFLDCSFSYEGSKMHFHSDFLGKPDILLRQNHNSQTQAQSSYPFLIPSQ